MKSNQPSEAEFKGLLEVLTQSTKDLFTLTPFRTDIQTVLRDEYTKGIDYVDKEIKPDFDLTMPSNSSRQLEALYNYVEQNMQDHVNLVSSRLRQEVQRGLQNNENKKEIISRVKRVFRDDKDVLNRLKTVIRTETNRANNYGRLDAAKQAEIVGLNVKKWLDVVPYQKGVSSPFCNTPGGQGKNSAFFKYGTKDKAIPIDQEFIVKHDNKTVRALAPPFHVNCRDVLRIVRSEQ